MRIDSSAVGMKSDRAYGKYEQKKTSSLITTKNKADSLELSDESKSLVEQLEEGKVQLKEKQEKQQKNQTIYPPAESSLLANPPSHFHQPLFRRLSRSIPEGSLPGACGMWLPP